MREGLSSKARQIELDKVERGEYTQSLTGIGGGGSSGQSKNAISYEYSRSESEAGYDFCLTGSIDNLAMHIKSGNQTVADGSCPDHADPSSPAPQIAYTKYDSFKQREGNEDTWIHSTIDFDLQPSDTVFIVFNSSYSTTLKAVKLGDAPMEQIYRKSMGTSGYQQTVAFRASGLSGPQDMGVHVCWYMQCNYGNSMMEAGYMVYVIRGKNNPEITYSDTTYAWQTRGSTITPDPMEVRRNDIAIFTYAYYGNNWPTINELSDPGVNWRLDHQKTSVSAWELIIHSTIIEQAGNVTRSLTMPDDRVTCAGATLFIIR